MQSIAIIQARMGSTRLPGKVLSKIKGKPMIVHIFDRLKKCQEVDHIILATSNLIQDKPLLDLAKTEGVQSFAGSEQDVLDRYYQAARQYKPNRVIRITGDCPIIDPQITDLVIKRHVEKKSDYTSNTVVRSYPRGLDTEVMTFVTLEKAAKEAQKPYEREHVTPYIYEHPESFSIEQVCAEPHRHQPNLRLTVDTPEDLELIQEIFNHLYDSDPYFSVDAVLNLMKQQPKLNKINEHIKQKMVIR